MTIGGMRHPIELQVDVSTQQDTAGGTLESWETRFIRFGKMNPGRGREFEAAQAIHKELTNVVTIRFEEQIEQAWRTLNLQIMFEGRKFEVLTCVNKDGRSRDLLIYCKELIR